MHKRSKNRRKTITRRRTRQKGGVWWPFTSTPKKVTTIPYKESTFSKNLPDVGRLRPEDFETRDKTFKNNYNDNLNRNVYHVNANNAVNSGKYAVYDRDYDDNLLSDRQEDLSTEDYNYNPRDNYNSDFSGSGRSRKRKTRRLKRVFF